MMRLRGPAWPWSTVNQQTSFFFGDSTHPFRALQEALEDRLSPTSSVLEIGCGREARMLRKLVGRARHLYGIDVVPFEAKDSRVILVRESVSRMMSIGDATIDLAYSKSVMEHVDNIIGAYEEIHRVLRPGGQYVFLTPNLFDYASMIAYLVPNRYHPAIVHLLEGRELDDVFPTYYRSNTKRRIHALAACTGFRVDKFNYLGQYPSYLIFNRSLFWLGCIYEKAIGKVPRLHCLRGWILCVLRKIDDGR